MKFYCHHCNKPYLIADERVRGKILKIRCKNCSTVITVREGLDQAAPPVEKSERRHSTAPAPAPLERPMTAPVRDLDLDEVSRSGSPGPEGDDDAMPPLDDEWYVSVDGVQEGPFSLERAREWVASRGPEDDVYCWRDTFDDWLPISDVAEFQGARRASKLALRPPPSTPSLSKIGQARVIDRAASTPDADLFGSEDEAMTRVDPRLFNGEPVLPVPRPPPSDTDEGPVMRLIVDDDAAADEAPAPDTGPMPSAPGPLGVPAIAGPAAGAAPVAQPPAARAWLSDPLSGPQPALRLPSPYPGSPAISDGRLSPLAMAPGRGPLSEPMPVRRRSRALLVVVLLLALIGSGAGAYLLVRTYVRPGSGQSALSPEDVSTELQRPSNQAALKQCYDLARQNSPALAIDRIDVDLTVDPAGRVAHVSLSQHADTPFGTCLIDSIHSWTFRASDKGVTARVPLIFGR